MRTLAAVLLLALAGCQTPGKPAGKSPSGSVKPGQAAAQQKAAYDRGVAHFASENYEEARKAWQEAARLGPGTPLGRKSAENLGKVDAILKSLRAIEGGK